MGVKVPKEIQEIDLLTLRLRTEGSALGHHPWWWWWWWSGGGGGGGGGGDGNLLLHDLLPSREGGCLLGVGIALLLHLPVFYRVLL